MTLLAALQQRYASLLPYLLLAGLLVLSRVHPGVKAFFSNNLVLIGSEMNNNLLDDYSIVLSPYKFGNAKVGFFL